MKYNYRYFFLLIFFVCIISSAQEKNSVNDSVKIYKKIELEPGEQIPYTDIQYNEYEIGVKFYPIEPISVKTINKECSIDPNTQLNKIMYKSFNGDNSHISLWADRMLETHTQE